MRHALVTGGAGFIGSHLVDLLLAEGWQVTVVDNFDPYYAPEIKRRNIAAHLAHPNYALVEADIRDLDILRERLSGEYEVIVHLAAKAGVRPSVLGPAAYYEVNVRGTLNLLELARERGVPQFVFASSSSVYGTNPNLPWREDDGLLSPASPYGATKLAGEALGRVYSHLYGIRFVALRIFTAYGPRQRPDLAIHKFARMMLKGEPVPVYGDGTARRDYTYIDDLVRGIRAAMDYRGSQYEIVNLGSGRPVTVLDMVRALESALGVKAQVQFLPAPPGEAPHTWADVGKSATLLNYRAETPLENGVAMFARWTTQRQNE